MIRAVLRKELRDQRPFAVLGGVILLLDLLSELLTDSLDLQPLSVTWPDTSHIALQVLLMILAFALGSGLLVRELDERTIELLDALPVRRWQLFAIKIAVALGALMIVPVGEVLEALALHALSRTSLDPGFHLALLFGWLALIFVQLFVALSVAVLLSFLRRLGWLILGVLACLMVALEDHHPLWRTLNPTALLEPHFRGDHWALPGQALALQVPVALACLGLSLALFSGAADRAFARGSKLLERGWVRWSLGVAFAGVVVWACFLIARSQGPEDAPLPKERPFAFQAPALGHARTRHYDFSFAADQEARAAPLIAHADETFETVARFLGVADAPPISVDLTGAPKHLLGVTHSSAIRMTLFRGGADERIATLAHETTHALSERIAEAGEQRGTLGEMRAFSEGLASYVEHRFFSPAAAEDARFWVAALRARDQLHFTQMIEGEAFLQTHDDTMVYPVGELLVAEAVKRYGDDAPRRLLDALGRKDPPKGLDGLKLWADTFQAAHMALGLVVDDLSREAESLAQSRRAELAAVPRPRAFLQRAADGRLEVHAALDRPLPEGWRLVCRFRPARDSRLEAFEDASERSPGVFRVPEEMVAAGRVWLQVGVWRRRSGHALYETWVQLGVP